MLFRSVPYRDITRPRMSLWELNTILKQIAERPELQPDEDTIFDGLREMEQIRRDAEEKSRAARRMTQRKAGWKQGASALRSTTSPSNQPIEVEQWPSDIQPFDDIEEPGQ